MKRLTTIIAMALVLVLPALAQQENRRPRFNPEEFNARMEAYIAQKAELTQTESDKVFPLFREMKAKQFEVMKKAQKLKFQREDQLKSDDDYQKALTQMGDLNIEAAKIEANYYKKMAKAVSAKKAYHVKMADDAFHREMLQRANNGFKDQNRKPKKRPN